MRQTMYRRIVAATGASRAAPEPGPGGPITEDFA